MGLANSDPRELTQAGPHTGRYLHGKTFRGRKIVLSKKLLDANKLTPVTLVRSSDMTSRFLEEVHAASRRAVENQASLLLLVFCHSKGNWEFLLDSGNREKGLWVAQLRGAIAKNCHTTLYSTARMPLEDTIPATARPKAMFDAWQNSPSIIRACGSIFANAVIDTLTSSTSPLLESGDRYEINHGKMMPEYLDPSNPSLSDSAAVPRMGGHVEVIRSKLMLNPTDKQVKEMAEKFLQTCPGDWNSGWGPLTRGCLRAFINGNSAPNPDVDVAAMMTFRWEVSLLADYMARYFNLTAPNNEPCIMWDSAAWMFKAPTIIPDYEERHEDAWSALRNARVEADPSDVQGPPFGRFADYLTAAVAVLNPSRESSLSVAGEMGEFMQRIRQSSVERNLEAPI
ncbi:hypothetical protein QIS74_08725 [Colletotrichum tabaci]|uniref:Uncharacterized protein n=1 Tax=Colletotrichum tabaci TaxID=1209068 RepID=A0AAV9TBR6_9PEZI